MEGGKQDIRTAAVRDEVETFDAIGRNRRALSSRFDQWVDHPLQSGDWYRRLGEGGRGSYGANGFQMNGWMLGSD